MSVFRSPILPAPESQKERDLTFAIKDAFRQIEAQFNGDIYSNYIEYTTNGTADTEDAVPHKVGRIPKGFVVVYQNKAGVLYDSGTTWTINNIYLKCSATSQKVRICLF